jgi:hypothetical protein
LDLSLDGLKLAHVPIINQLFKADIYPNVSTRPLSQQSRHIGKLSHHTVVTPEVHAQSMAFFLQHFKVMKPHNQAFRTVDHTLYKAEVHDASPTIKWIGSSSDSFIYGAAKIGKTTYMVQHFHLNYSLLLYLTIIYQAWRSCYCASWRRP